MPPRRPRAPGLSLSDRTAGDLSLAPLKLVRYLKPSCVVPALKARTKQEAIEELLDCLRSLPAWYDVSAVRDDVFAREEQMSTGLTDGLAIPHAKSSGARQLCVAIGLKPEGIDFASLDDKPSKAIFLVVSRVDRAGPHLECLAEIAQFYSRPEARERLLRARNVEEIVAALDA